MNFAWQKLFGWMRKKAAKPRDVITHRRDYFRDPSVWVSVASSNVSAIAFRPVQDEGDEPIMGVRFRNGIEYHYSGVAESVYQGMLAAQSKGNYVWVHLRDKYPYSRIG